MKAGASKGKGQSDGDGSAACPLCGQAVAASGKAASALNRHFETDCTWRHTSRSPARLRRGA